MLAGLRPEVRGKFLYVGDEKLYVRGATYGTFGGEDGGYHPDAVERDFAAMASNGVNAVRVYTSPPRWLLDAAAAHDLRVMVGLPWEQHIAFLDTGVADDIKRRVGETVEACAGHPAVLCYAVGNEIPAPIVRWHGRARVERFLERLYDAAKAADPGGLVTYVNYPTTEYLELPFLDLVSFNVYLESRDRLEAYLARLHNLADAKPLMLAEVGLDSRRGGEAAQAEGLDWQIRSAFASGCAGVLLFAWTDEWSRGGHEVDDWDFGLTRRDRQPKPALAAARRAFADAPFASDAAWPTVSVVVCTHNGASTLPDTLEGLRALAYPSYETIVVDDGSTDGSAEIAREFGVTVIETENRGLSAARNTGLEAAGGEIVSYLDDDARPDPHWLSYLAATFMTTDHVGVGGPNLAPAGDGPIADCVANAPGGPVHVLESDREAEHIPGCNMAFRRRALLDLGGFDPRFRAAGDDVDVCWRLREAGQTIGYSPSALVWHHRRNSLRAFWRQQRGYGKAEALLERKWRERYNAVGHLAWKGRIYGKGLIYTLGLRRARVYSGTWGTAPFQSMYRPANGSLSWPALMPEWYLVVLALAALSGLGALWRPLLVAVPALLLALTLPLAQAASGGARATFADPPRSRLRRVGLRTLTAGLHLAQPLARLWGRLRHGLTPWRRRGAPALALPRARTFMRWRERWEAPEDTLRSIERRLRAGGAVVRRGGDFDSWDLEVRGGLLGAARIRAAVEEHGQGHQLARARAWPRPTAPALAMLSGLGLLAVVAALDGAPVVDIVLGALAAVVGVRALGDCAVATASIRAALGRTGMEARR